MNFQKVKLSDLKFPEYNPRKKLTPEDEEYQKIKNSIEQFGYVDPIIVNQDNTIVGGNQRSSILIDLGYDEVDVVRVDLPKEKEKALNIALNKLSGEWDFDKLAELLNEIKIDNIDNFNLTGFDTKEFEKIMSDFDKKNNSEDSKSIDDNFDAEETIKQIVEPVSQLGDVFQLGNHILMCGNSFDIEQVKKLINGNKIDMMFTDPPYDMQMGGKGCFEKSTKKIRERVQDLINFDVNKINFFPELNIPCYYIFTSKEGIKKYFSIFDDYIYNILIWGKTNSIPFTNNGFIPDVEYCLYFYNEKIKRIWNNSLKPAEVYKKYYISSIQHPKKEDGNLHPTMKPIELISNRIRISSNQDGIVLDLFGGSGSTLIASELNKRKCYMMEINPVYCDVIINRYIKYKDESDSDIFLLTDKDKKIPWNEISKYRPVRKD